MKLPGHFLRGVWVWLLLAAGGLAPGGARAVDPAASFIGWEGLDPPPACKTVEGSLINDDWSFARWRCQDGQYLVLERAIGRSGPQLLTRVVHAQQLLAVRDEDFVLCVRGERLLLAHSRDWAAFRAGRLPKDLRVWGFDLERGRIQSVSARGMRCEFLDD